MKRFVSLSIALAMFACTPDGGKGKAGAGREGFVVGSITITEDTRMMYVQFVDKLQGHLDNTHAIEIAGNAILEAQGDDIFAGLVEEPTWVRYSVNEDGVLEETGRLSFAAHGWAAIDYGNTFLSDTLAFSFSTALHQGIFWNPSDLSILSTLDIPEVAEEGYDIETFPVTNYDGLIYMPVTRANWTQGLIKHETMYVIIDPSTRKVKQVVSDDRCPVAGEPTFDAQGNLYSITDGRNYAAQMYARAAGETDIARNCALKLPKGASAFDPDWQYDVVDLTDGHETITAAQVAKQGSGVAFAQVFYEDQLPDGVEPIDFNFWGYPMSKLWKFDMNTTPPTATEVTGLGFMGIGFSATRVDDQLLLGASADATDGQVSEVYRIDADKSTVKHLFSMDGYYYGAFPVGGAHIQ